MPPKHIYKGPCKLTYYTGDVVVEANTYENQRLALQLFALDGEPIATATVNLPDEKMAFDEIAVKDYSENLGMRGFLYRAGIIRSGVVRWAHSGFVDIPIMQLTPKALLAVAKGG